MWEILSSPRVQRIEPRIRTAALAAARRALGDELRLADPPHNHLDPDAPSDCLSPSRFRTRLDSPARRT
jgi:hypothetical protein